MRTTSILKKNRVESLTDGIFSVAMTILVLGIQLPTTTTADQLSKIVPHLISQNFLIYAGSFFILGTYWIAVNFMQGFLERVNRIYCWIVLFFLMIICGVPFSASLFMEYPDEMISIHVYIINLLAGNAFLWLMLEYATRNKLNNKSFDGAYGIALKRILIAPAFYLAAFVVAHWNIKLAFILLILPPVIYLFPGKLDVYGVD